MLREAPAAAGSKAGQQHPLAAAAGEGCGSAARPQRERVERKKLQMWWYCLGNKITNPVIRTLPGEGQIATFSKYLQLMNLNSLT